MGLFRAKPIVMAEVALLAPDRAAARVIAPGGAGDEVGPGERVRMAVGLVAAAHHRSPDTRVTGLEECLVELARAIAGPDPAGPGERLVHLGPLGVRDFLTLDPWGAEPRGLIAAELVAVRGGAAVPRITASPAFAGPSAEIAALALAQHVAAGADADGRLAVGLGIEGVLAWYREAHRMSQPSDALTFALVHMADRMAHAGRSVPPGID
ncbi:MAG: hypothetical protein ACLGG9_05480 [Thermoleophilia bacterium]